MEFVNLVIDTAEQVTDQAKPWIIKLARFGFAAKGIVYIVIGILAFQAALGARSARVNQEDALEGILTQPFGMVLLGMIALGLVAYVLWRFIQAIFDPERVGTKLKGIVDRIGYVISGLGYAGLAGAAFQLLLGIVRSDSNGPQDWTARLLAMPLGPWLVGLVGLIILGVGVYQFYSAFTKKFMQRYKLSNQEPTAKHWGMRLGRIGISARGVVYVIVAIFLVQAALQHNASRAGGLGDAFQALALQPYGPWLLGLVALGLVAYGVHAILYARIGRLILR